MAARNNRFDGCPLQYKHAEDYWRTLWEALATEAGIIDAWESPWLAAPLYDGSPIFSAVSRSQGRAIHVIQHEPTTDALELEWWIDEFGEQGVDAIIQQLVISCALPDEAAERATQMMRSWAVCGKIGPASENPA